MSKRIPFPFDQNIAEMIADGHRPILVTRMWYPVIEVEVVLRERSREEMSEVELAFLDVIKAGITRFEEMVSILAVRERFANQILSTLRDQGLIEVAGREAKISDLGLMSLAEGALIQDTQRAVIACGLTGELLPLGAHDVPRIRPGQALSRIPSWMRVYEPRDGVPHKLLSLDISRLRDQGGRDALANVGIPDEAVSIQRILGSQGMFVEAGLIVGAAERGAVWHADVWMNRGLRLRGIGRMDQFVPDAEIAIAEAARNTEDLMLNLSEKGLVLRASPQYAARRGLEAIIDGFTPREPLLLQGRSLLSRFGTSRQIPLPIWEFIGQKRGDSQKRDFLDGACLYLTITDKAMSEKAEALRIAWKAVDAYLAKPYKQRVGSSCKEVGDALSADGLSVEKTLEAAIYCGDSGLVKHLSEDERTA
ncbi:MAG: hypothetical protein A2286_01955 [Gammaproteobacteria bacterium RIFOXYA12_FULL_61_12]|nr:MAG: hypothetical protein A2514_07975 [Gammaproteobacteria bacterium RIFOXYD12_FULL_61_37]OGT93807.1 MAG: hypothetical protein A2286_01955 [Gammaproteobacteria bacterium RIFOXYA12_FULL_61_12]